MKLVVAIHGILTSQTDVSWPDKFDVWMAKRGVKVIKKEYRAGPFPRLNVWLKDPWLARGLANEIREFCVDEATGEILETHIPEIWFVAHSNGCVITLMTVKRLVALGIPVAGIILVGGACEADVNKSRLLEWVATGKVGQATAFSSLQDLVVASRFIWPFGHLGYRGFTSEGEPFTLGQGDARRLWTEWFPGYGHSGYFADKNREKIFTRFHEIITA